MAPIAQTASGSSVGGARKAGKKPTFWEQQQLAKQKAYEKQAKKKRIKLEELCVFTNQLASMLEA